MSDWIRQNDLALFIAAFVLALVLGSFGIVKWNEAECNAKTADIGYDHRFGFFTGCQIEITEGRWIPLDAYYYQERP